MVAVRPQGHVGRLRGRLVALVVVMLGALGAAWCLHEAQYLGFSAPTGRRIVHEAGLERAVSITVEGSDRGRTAACTDAAALADFTAWLSQATGQRQREPGGPTPLEQWFVTLDDGSEAQIAWWDLKSTRQGTPVPTITGEVWAGGSQCLLRLPREGFDRLRRRLGADWNWDLERLQTAGCGEVAIGPPPVARFEPVVDSTGALAYSGAGLCLAFPETGVTADLHPVQPKGRVADWGLAWSPDGGSIAFVHSVIEPRLECRFGYIMLADLKSGEVRALDGVPQVYDSLAWSPDGERLAFIAPDTPGMGYLGVLDLRRGASWVGGEPVWWQERQAPVWLDDAQVACIRVNGLGARQARDLVSWAAEGGEARVLVPGADGPFAFSPDRKQVAWSGGSEVFVATLETGESFPLGAIPDLRSLQWAPDGRHILAHGGLGGLYLVRPVAGESWRHLDLSGAPADPQAWSPDGRGFVVFPVGEEGAPGVGFYDVQDGSLRSLPIAVARPRDVAWAPGCEPAPVSDP